MSWFAVSLIHSHSLISVIKPLSANEFLFGWKFVRIPLHPSSIHWNFRLPNKASFTEIVSHESRYCVNKWPNFWATPCKHNHLQEYSFGIKILPGPCEQINLVLCHSNLACTYYQELDHLIRCLLASQHMSGRVSLTEHVYFSQCDKSGRFLIGYMRFNRFSEVYECYKYNICYFRSCVTFR